VRAVFLVLGLGERGHCSVEGAYQRIGSSVDAGVSVKGGSSDGAHSGV
jgi:hypothetical protein